MPQHFKRVTSLPYEIFTAVHIQPIGPTYSAVYAIARCLSVCPPQAGDLWKPAGWIKLISGTEATLGLSNTIIFYGIRMSLKIRVLPLEIVPNSELSLL